MVVVHIYFAMVMKDALGKTTLKVFSIYVPRKWYIRRCWQKSASSLSLGSLYAQSLRIYMVRWCLYIVESDDTVLFYSQWILTKYPVIFLQNTQCNHIWGYIKERNSAFVLAHFFSLLSFPSLLSLSPGTRVSSRLMLLVMLSMRNFSGFPFFGNILDSELSWLSNFNGAFDQKE